MNRLIVGIVVVLVAAGAGAWLESRWGLLSGGSSGAGAGQSGEREILYWVAPMDPNFRRDGPGKSPMGMDLVPVYADQAGAGDDAVALSPEVVQNLGVRTATAETGPLWRRIEATGHVGIDEDLASHVHLRTQGWIQSLAVASEGDPVRRGQVLFTLYSPELVNAQREYLQVLRRDAALLAEGAAEKLRSLGMTDDQIASLARRGTPSERMPVLSPQDGVVTALNVRENMFVGPAAVVMELADLSRVWVHARVFEAQAEWVQAGQPAEVVLDYLPGRRFEGTVDYVYPVLDPKTRTLRVRLVFDNPDGLLKPNMFARVVIYGGARRDVLSVPRDALIRSGDRDRVVVAPGGGRFEVREVLAGMESGDWVEIRRGLAAGERVVVSAQFLIDSEASLSGSIRRLSDWDEPDAPGSSRPESAAAPEPVFGAGTVNAVDPGARTVNLSHDPIDALGWPAMTMDLPVADDVDLVALAAGAEIHFSLVPDGAGGYRIGMIHVMSAGAGHDHD